MFYNKLPIRDFCHVPGSRSAASLTMIEQVLKMPDKMTVYKSQLKDFKHNTILHYTRFTHYFFHGLVVTVYLIMFSKFISTTAVTWSNACQCPVFVNAPLCSALPSHRPIFSVYTETGEGTSRTGLVLPGFLSSAPALHSIWMYRAAVGISSIWYCGISGHFTSAHTAVHSESVLKRTFILRIAFQGDISLT